MNSKKSRNQRGRKGPAAARDAAPVDLDQGVEGQPRSLGAALAHGIKVLSGALFVAGISAALAFGLHHYARTTPRFAITDVSVEGIRRLAREDVLGAAGLRLGENIFSFDTGEAETKLAKSPWVRTAEVHRKLPGTIQITISEHQPAALLVVSGRTYLISDRGLPIKEVSPSDPHDFPLITGVSTSELVRDRRAEQARIQAGLELLEHYAELPLAKNYPVEELHLEEDGAAVLTVGTAGLTLALGAPPWTASLHRATRIAERTAQEGGTPGVVFLDNEAHPERVVVRLR